MRGVEHFFGFIGVFDKTGAGLSGRILKMLYYLGVNVNYMRD